MRKFGTSCYGPLISFCDRYVTPELQVSMILGRSSKAQRTFNPPLAPCHCHRDVSQHDLFHRGSSRSLCLPGMLTLCVYVFSTEDPNASAEQSRQRPLNITGSSEIQSACLKSCRLHTKLFSTSCTLQLV